MNKILLTGCAGSIGSTLAKKLVDKGFFVVGIDNLSTGSMSKLHNLIDSQFFQFVRGDCNDVSFVENIFSLHTFTYVFHFAAVVGVQRTQSNPLLVLDDIKGVRNILESCISHKVQKIFYASSSEVYGEPVEIPLFEDTSPLNSKVPYAVVKNVGESFVRSYNKKYDLDFTILRFFNTYGPNQSTDFVVPLFLDCALKGNDISIYGDGSQYRTFCYIDDTVDTIFATLVDEQYSKNNTINIGSDVVHSILDLANKIINISKSKSSIKFIDPLPEGDMARRLPDIKKMRTLLLRDLIPLEEGISKLIDFKNAS